MKFLRSEYHRYRRLGKSWRKPRGRHHKVRRSFEGKPASPRIGYRGKAEQRGLHPSGYAEVLVRTPEELESLDKDRQAVRIAGSVGKKKREKILKKAKKLKLKVLN
jgi:large subunit ribosomal protein L32e